MSEVYDLYTGTRLEHDGVAADDREVIAQMFEMMAAEAREGRIENFVTILMRSEVNYTVRCWRRETLRLVGACESAKQEILNNDAAIEYIEELLS